jgi:transcriptional regulator with XRE-family HTH domain
MIIEVIISELDFYLIEKIRELRIKSKISQMSLAQKIGVSEGYIGNIENHKQPNKYNIRLLSRTAVALGLKSYIDLFPEKVCSNDIVKIKIELKERKGKEEDELLQRFKSIAISPLSEEEILEYDKKKRKN